MFPLLKLRVTFVNDLMYNNISFVFILLLVPIFEVSNMIVLWEASPFVQLFYKLMLLWFLHKFDDPLNDY